MKRLLALSFVIAAGGCYATSPPVTWDNSQQLNADRRFAHNSAGQIIYGPSFTYEIVEGQRDAAGNVHTDWIPQPTR